MFVCCSIWKLLSNQRQSVWLFAINLRVCCQRPLSSLRTPKHRSQPPCCHFMSGDWVKRWHCCLYILSSFLNCFIDIVFARPPPPLWPTIVTCWPQWSNSRRKCELLWRPGPLKHTGCIFNLGAHLKMAQVWFFYFILKKYMVYILTIFVV